MDKIVLVCLWSLMMVSLLEAELAVPFTKVVVLMMENQSFDHLLGYLPGVGKLMQNPAAYYNVNPDGQRIYASSGLDVRTGALLDRPHDAKSVITQMWGQYTESPGPYPTGSYFVQDVYSSDPHNVQSQSQYMQSYAPVDVPNLSTLAQSFVVCDKWFASVPGSTGPNRLFLHTASSGGYAGTDWNEAGFQVPIPLLTVFEMLDKGTKEDAWKIYEQDMYSDQTSLCLSKFFNYTIEHKDRVLELDEFMKDIGTSNQPKYSFLVPRLCPESQHPGCNGNITSGDDFIGEIYNAIRGGPAWLDTLFVITYDEHGGYYESTMPYGISVPAPEINGPVDWYPTNNIPFDFQSLGPRIPTLLISAYLDPGVDSTQYEHASMSKSLLNVFDARVGPHQGYLTSRDYGANDFIAAQSWRASPRMDAPILKNNGTLSFPKILAWLSIWQQQFIFFQGSLW